MKQAFIFCSLVCVFHSWLCAQYETVDFNYERNYFNEGQPLPSETKFILKGTLPPAVEMVEVLIYDKGWIVKGREARYTSTWKKSFANSAQTFEIPVEFKLRPGREYDFQINYFRPIEEETKQLIKTAILRNLKAYLSGTFEMKQKKLTISQPSKLLLRDLNEVVENGLQYYRNTQLMEFPGFSSLVAMKIKQTSETNIKTVIPDSISKANTDSERTISEFNKAIGELHKMMELELDNFLNTKLFVLSDRQNVYSYETKKNANIIAINAGYGGVYLDGDFNNLSYDSGPYIGLSFPLGKDAFGSKFWSNSAISFGVYLLDFEDDEGNKVSGPIVKRPFYVGYGYRVLDFIRLNAGISVLEKASEEDKFLELNNLMVKPFVGASIELRFWVGLGDRTKP